MSHGATTPAARLRGSASGALTAALAVAAQATAGGGCRPAPPSRCWRCWQSRSARSSRRSPVAAASVPRSPSLRRGQLLGHVAARRPRATHHRPPRRAAAAPDGGRAPRRGRRRRRAHRDGEATSAPRCRARCWPPTRPPRRPIAAASATAFAQSADQPLQSALRLAASMSHRGPPVGARPLTDDHHSTQRATNST